MSSSGEQGRYDRCNVRKLESIPLNFYHEDTLAAMETFVTSALLGGGLLMVALGALVILLGLRRQQRAEPPREVVARVVAVEQQRRPVRINRDGTSETTHRVAVARTVHDHPATGLPVEHEIVLPGQHGLAPGDPLVLEYDAADPDTVRLPGSGGAPALQGLIGIVLIVTGLIAALVSTKLV